MEPSHHPIQYHLARAIMHLNRIASFLPSFELPADWGTNPPFLRPHGQSSARHLHKFVPLPTESRPLASLASHGDLPSHFVTNPEPHFRAMSHRTILHADHGINRTASSAPPSPHDEIHIDEDHSGRNRPAPRAKQASQSTAPRGTVYPDNFSGHDPSAIRSSKRPRTAYMVESVNRFGSPPHDGASSHARSIRLAIPELEAVPPTIRHNSIDADSDDLDHGVAKAPSPTPTLPGHTSSTHAIPVEAPSPAPNPLDPALADHRNRPWPPCDDREFIQYKMDTKSRPSWKTIAKRMNRTAESCQARWQWLKKLGLAEPSNSS